MDNNSLNELLAGFRKELSGYLEEMFGFSQDRHNPYDILQRLSAMSARAGWIRSQVVRSNKREIVLFKSEEVDPFLKQVDLQFRIWSRVAALVKDEYDMSRS